MSDSDAKPHVDVTINPDPDFKFGFTALRASEELGRPFLFELDVSSGKVKGDLTSLLGSSATVTISVDDKTKRYFNGIIARASYEGLAAGAHRYRLELRPWIWLLSRIRTSRIFQNQSVWDVITTVFRDANFTDYADKRQNGTGDIMLDYCVQYRGDHARLRHSADGDVRALLFLHAQRQQAHAGDGGRPEFPRRPGEGGSVQYR